MEIHIGRPGLCPHNIAPEKSIELALRRRPPNAERMRQPPQRLHHPHRLSLPLSDAQAIIT